MERCSAHHRKDVQTRTSQRSWLEDKCCWLQWYAHKRTHTHLLLLFAVLHTSCLVLTPLFYLFHLTLLKRLLPEAAWCISHRCLLFLWVFWFTAFHPEATKNKQTKNRHRMEPVRHHYKTSHSIPVMGCCFFWFLDFIFSRHCFNSSIKRQLHLWFIVGYRVWLKEK